jgi:hypothetical protein
VQLIGKRYFPAFVQEKVDTFGELPIISLEKQFNKLWTR